MDVVLKKDLLHVRYDPDQVTQEQMLKAIEKEAFTAKVVTDKTDPAQ